MVDLIFICTNNPSQKHSSNVMSWGKCPRAKMRELESLRRRNKIINVSLGEGGGKGKLQDMMFCSLF